MTCASLLVAVEDSPDSDARLELACDLSLALGAHLTGLCAGYMAPPLYDPLAGGAMLGELMAWYREAAGAEVEQARVRFRAIVEARAIAADWQGQIGDPAMVCSAAARGADLVMLGTRKARAPATGPDVADVLMACGRPVLVVPPNRLRNPVGEPALVAWNDRREARIALTLSLPLLRLASHVVLYAVDPRVEMPSTGAGLDEVVTWLERHCVAAEAVVVPPGDASTGRQILDEALTRKAGLIVAGGYGHARLREWAWAE
ncbi:universal stress protein [Brevundimonas sp. R86498]|uniref:universal stress protein n=1 Tax=Brevundimonas sp. R86498 TaxID=3093845 RepID=UPI0037C53C38